jgi:hypothetical protein
MRVLAPGLFLAGLLAVVSTGEAQPPGGGKEEKDKGGFGKGGKAVSTDDMVARLMAFDANKDGKLTKEELNDARLHPLFERADANKDGVVTKDELTALLTKEAAELGAGKGGPGDKGDKGGGKGDKGEKGDKGDKGDFPGGPGGFGPPRPGEIFPSFIRDQLKLTAEQKKKYDELQKDLDAKLDKLLTEEQKKQLKEFTPPAGFPPFPGGPGGPPGGAGGPPKENDAPVGVAPPPRAKLRDVPVTPANLRAAVEKAMPPLWTAVEGHSESRSCFTCHNHAVPLLAFTTARDRGFTVPKDKLAGLVEFVATDMGRHRDRFARGQGPGPFPAGGETDNTGYALFALDVGGHKADATTAAIANYTLGKDKSRDHWGFRAPRPPSEHSLFTPTAMAVRGLQKFAPDDRKAEAAERVKAARGWLLKTPARDTEDRVFKLVGLKAAGATADELQAAAKELLDTQRADGGWGQLDSMPSDAYATGSALWALHTAAGVPNDGPAYRGGLKYLLGSQADDGTWHVRTRSNAIQRYFETGFPYGKDQFISCAATGWATAAVALACPPKP